MLEKLGMMDLLKTANMGHNSIEYLHTFAEVTKLTYWDRLAYSGDPEVKPPPYDRLLSADYWQERIALIDTSVARDFDSLRGRRWLGQCRIRHSDTRRIVRQ
jgi:gamma-glutamyltranspeptidase/glutathione hydrolase